MNQLETLVIPTETVKFGSVEYEVRGLGLAHIMLIVKEHRSLLADLYEQGVSGKLENSVEQIVFRLAEDALPLVALVIACGMDSPQHADKAAQLPLSVQVDAIEKIVRLTLVAEGGLEKLMETVTRVMAGAASLTSLKT